ncbi:hypothetical protein HK405_003612, partial [Cladochytrium tenue]
MNELVPHVLASVDDQHGGRYASARSDLAAVSLVSRAWAAAALPLLYRRLWLEWYATETGDISGDEKMKARDDGNDFPDSESYCESNVAISAAPKCFDQTHPSPPGYAINPPVYVRDLQLSYIAHEDILYEALEALKWAGSRLERLELRLVIFSEKLLGALEPLALSVYHISSDRNEDGATVLSGALAAGGTSHFPKLRHLEMFRTTAAILDDVATMCPALQRLDLPATVESLEPLRRLRRLRLVILRLPLPERADPEVCFNRAVEFVMPLSAGQKSSIEE